MMLLASAGRSNAQSTAIAHADSILDKLDRTDLIDFMVNVLNLGDNGKVNRDKKTDKLLFSVIPIAPGGSGDGKVAISAINAAFYLGKDANISSVYFYPYTNFSGSYGLILTPNIWFDKNRWNGVGDFRFIHNNIPDYGLGTGTTTNNPTDIQYEQVRTYFTAHTRLTGYTYIGAGYNLDYFYSLHENVNPEQPQSDFSNYGIGTGPNVTSSGITANFLQDNRKNSVNPRNGIYTTVILRFNSKAMGSTYNWGSLYAEGRRYQSFSKARHKIFAYRGIFWSTFGDVPYFNLPATFQDLTGRAGRGYSNNRFRGKSMLYGEAEYRFDISKRGFLGGVVFANAQSFTEMSTGKFEYVAPAAGAGLRLKFNRNSDTNIALDLAIGRDGLNFYVNLGEIF